MSDEHRCAAGRSCRNLDRTDGKLQPAITTKPHSLCESCTGATRQAVNNLSHTYYLAVAATTMPTTTGTTQKVSGTPEPSIPINPHFDALAVELADSSDEALTLICPALNITHPAPWKGRGYPRPSDRIIKAAAKILPTNLPKLFDAPDGVDAALRIVNARRRILGAIGDPNPRKRLALPCPLDTCGAHHSLGIDNGQTDVTCSACGGRWTEREYEWLAGLVVADIDLRKKRSNPMLEWLLAEARWQSDCALWLYAERDWKMRRITTLSADDLENVSGATVVALLTEQVN